MEFLFGFFLKFNNIRLFSQDINTKRRVFVTVWKKCAKCENKIFCYEARPDVVFAFAPASSKGESVASTSTRTARRNLFLPMAAPARKYSTINTHLICSERGKITSRTAQANSIFINNLACFSSTLYFPNQTFVASRKVNVTSHNCY